MSTPSSDHARWGIGLACAGSLCGYWRGGTDVYALPKLGLLAVGTGAAWLALASAGGPGLRRPTELDRPLTAFLAAFVIALAASLDPFVGLVGKYSSYSHGLVATLLFAGLYLATAWSQEPDRPDRLLRASLWLGAAAGGYGLLQRFGVDPLGLTAKDFALGRVGSFQGGPVPLGACLLMFLPLAAHFTLTGSRRFGAAAGALVAGGLFFTFSRGAWLGGAAALAAYAVLSGRVDPRSWSARARGGAAAAAVVLLLLGAGLASAFRPVAQSDGARWELWVSAARAVGEHPWLGTGPDTFQTALRKHRTVGFLTLLGNRASQLNAHNDLLQALSTAGLLGLAAYAWLLWGAGSAVARGLADPRRRSAAAAVGAAVLGLFVQLKFNAPPLAALAFAAVWLGLLAPAPAAPSRLVRPLGALACAFCAAAALLALRLHAADRRFHRGNADLAGRPFAQLTPLRDAVRLNPYELLYRLSLARALYEAGRRTEVKAERIALAEEAAAQGREAAVLRPNEVEGPLILGTYLMVVKLEGGPDRLEEAQAALDRIAPRDPLFLPLLENRYKLAELRGRPERARELKAEYDRVAAIAGRL